MTEILNQDEIDALLTAISTGEVECGPVKEEKKVRIYDFRRPDKFSKDHIRTIQMMHETFARLTSVMLSAKIRAAAGIHVASVDQLTYEEFIRSVPNPTCMAIMNVKPLAVPIVMEIDPSITFTIIDKLAGGMGHASKISRELTDIELMLMDETCSGIIANLKYAWSNVIEINPEIVNIETNPQFAQIVPPNDMVLLVTLESKIGDVEGMMNLVVPYITIEPVLEKLSAEYMFTSALTPVKSATAGLNDSAVYKRHVLYSGAAANMKPDDMRRLRRGARIPLMADDEVLAEVVYEYAGIKKEAGNE